MKTAIARGALVAFLVTGVVACADDEMLAKPGPASYDGDAVGYFCGMAIAEHTGPKAQVFLRGQSKPFWFSSVRDAIAFTMLPGEPKSIAAAYVSDMGTGNWERPETSTWIEARDAWFVVGSEKAGGMGAPETVPFAERAAAEAFAAAHGGAVMRFEDVPEDAVLGSVAGPPAAGHDIASSDAHGAQPVVR